MSKRVPEQFRIEDLKPMSMDEALAEHPQHWPDAVFLFGIVMGNLIILFGLSDNLGMRHSLTVFNALALAGGVLDGRRHVAFLALIALAAARQFVA